MLVAYDYIKISRRSLELAITKAKYNQRRSLFKSSSDDITTLITPLVLNPSMYVKSSTKLKREVEKFQPLKIRESSEIWGIGDWNIVSPLTRCLY